MLCLGTRRPCVSRRGQPALVERLEELWTYSYGIDQRENYRSCLAAVEDAMGGEYTAARSVGRGIDRVATVTIGFALRRIVGAKVGVRSWSNLCTYSYMSVVQYRSIT